MKGSIELARLICVEIAGDPVPNDSDGDSYGSIEIAEILSAGYERLRAENEALKSRIAGGVRVLVGDGGYKRPWNITAHYNSDQRLTNATLLLDEQEGGSAQ